MSHRSRYFWPLALATAVPVLSLAGCPLGGGSTTPTPTPAATATPTPTATPATPAPTATPAPAAGKLIINRLKFGSAGSEHRVWLENIGGTSVDLSTWIFCNQYRNTTDQKKSSKPYYKVAKSGKTLAGGATISIDVNATSCTDGTDTYCLGEAATGNPAGVSFLDVQASQGGALALFKNDSYTASDSVTDFVQWNTAPADGNYDRAQVAKDAGKWDDVAKYVTGVSGGKLVSRKTKTAYGSTAWEVK